MTLAEELFKYRDVRERRPEERLYRIVEEILDDRECSLWRITWDWYDCSVEIYCSEAMLPDEFDLGRLWEAGFARVWIHPARCTNKDGQRDMCVCKCPSRKKP